MAPSTKYLSEADAESGSFLFKGETITASNSLSLIKNARSTHPVYNTFLSHSTKDNLYLAGAVSLLTKHGAHVYLDKNDPCLPTPPNPATAQRLRVVIQACNRLVIAVSSNTTTSNWIPWELGIADGDKGYDCAALLPITSNGNYQSWVQKEYFAIYPRIRYSTPLNQWTVFDPQSKSSEPLTNWLK